MSKTPEPPPMHDDLQRVLGVVTSLAGEVFLLKAEVHRLRTALSQNEVLSAQAVEAAAATDEFKRFLQLEERQFAPTIFRPFLHPDEVPDVSHLMRQSREPR